MKSTANEKRALGGQSRGLARCDRGILRRRRCRQDTGSTIRRWNAGAERIFGYTANEIIGRSGLVLMPPERRRRRDERTRAWFDVYIGAPEGEQLIDTSVDGIAAMVATLVLLQDVT